MVYHFFLKRCRVLCGLGLLSFIIVSAMYAVSRREKSEQERLLDVDFDVSLGVVRFGKQHFYKRAQDQECYETCQRLWSAHRPSIIKEKTAGCIPKIIHQIWLFQEPFPDMYKKLQLTWVKNHPGWQYHLWTEKDVQKLPEPIRVRIVSSKDVNEKTNILKAAILVQIGGVVIDVGFESLSPLDVLHEKYDLYVSLEPPLEKPVLGSVLHISPLLVGACPHHPSICKWQREMDEKYSAVDADPSSKNRMLFCASSPLEIAVQEHAFDGGYKNIILPPTYFFPLNQRWISVKKNIHTKRKNGIVLKKILSYLGGEDPLFCSISPESLAVHHHGGVWADKLPQSQKGSKYKKCQQRAVIQSKK